MLTFLKYAVIAVACLFVLMALFVVVAIYIDKAPNSRVQHGESPITHTVVYKVEGYPPAATQSLFDALPADLTYQNASGGTEQTSVVLPWWLEMKNQKEGKFVYVSAQKKPTYLTIHVTIFVDGRLLQEAQSGGNYGIASASGSVH